MRTHTHLQEECARARALVRALPPRTGRVQQQHALRRSAHSLQRSVGVAWVAREGSEGRQQA